MSSPDPVMASSYDYRLVVLSVLISILAAYAVVDLAGRVTACRGGSRLAWLMGGATASGIGTWSMHYTGMLAFNLPVPVRYDWPTVVLSYLPAFFAAAVALFVVSGRPLGWLRTLAAAVLMGGGIAGMHYTAMAAMRLPAMCRYSPALVTLSVVFAILFSLMGLRQAFPSRGARLRKISSVLLLGAANPALHYTGMAAASFTPSTLVPDLSHAVRVSLLVAEGITIVPLMVLSAALVTSLVDRLEKQRTLLDHLFEQAPQAVVLTDADNRVMRVNREFAQLFGYSPQEALGRRLDELIVPGESADEFQRHVEAAARGERVDTESIRRRKDGTRLQVSVVRVPVSLPDGQTAVYAILRDISERKRAEEDLRRSLAQLRALTARLQHIREEERTRVAREIHDQLGQALAAIKFDVSSLASELPEDNRPRAESVLRLVDEAIQSVREISAELRPAVLDNLGLVPALEWAAEEFQARSGIKCRLEVPQHDIAIHPERATALFRIFQEALTNVALHAEATTVDVRLASENGDLSLEIKDNGKGIGDQQLSAPGSLGLLGMGERALLLGGELSIRGAPGRGTTVRVRIPAAAHL